MLTLTLPETDEFFDESNQEFVKYKEVTLRFEHSLSSISKWESKHHKTWLSRTNKKTNEEILDYIACMCLDDIGPEFIYRLDEKMIKVIDNYINDPMTAIYFPKEEDPIINNEAQTSELIYYCMISNNIPFECQYWHFNKLLSLIRVCNMKNKDPNKSGKNNRQLASQYAKMNAARRSASKTKG